MYIYIQTKPGSSIYLCHSPVIYRINSKYARMTSLSEANIGLKQLWATHLMKTRSNLIIEIFEEI
jgi:hypothetical protein